MDSAGERHRIAVVAARLLATNSVGRVFSLSLDIFAQLALNFRESLKGEIGVFFKEVLLRLLETPNSSEKQKLAGEVLA